MRQNLIQSDGLPLELLKEATVSKENESWTFQDGDVKFYVIRKNGRVYFNALKDKKR